MRFDEPLPPTPRRVEMTSSEIRGRFIFGGLGVALFVVVAIGFRSASDSETRKSFVQVGEFLELFLLALFAVGEASTPRDRKFLRYGEEIEGSVVRIFRTSKGTHLVVYQYSGSFHLIQDSCRISPSNAAECKPGDRLRLLKLPGDRSRAIPLIAIEAYQLAR